MVTVSGINPQIINTIDATVSSTHSNTDDTIINIEVSATNVNGETYTQSAVGNCVTRILTVIDNSTKSNKETSRDKMENQDIVILIEKKVIMVSLGATKYHIFDICADNF